MKYQSLFDAKEEIDAPITLVVKRKRKNKNNKCRCHHMKIAGDGMCCFGRCRHEAIHHKTMELGAFM